MVQLIRCCCCLTRKRVPSEPFVTSQVEEAKRNKEIRVFDLQRLEAAKVGSRVVKDGRRGERGRQVKKT